MNPKAKALLNKAQAAKSLYAAGDISYEELHRTASEYINFANERAVAIAKQYGMKPKKMSVKAWLR